MKKMHQVLPHRHPRILGRHHLHNHNPKKIMSRMTTELLTRTFKLRLNMYLLEA